MTTFKEQFPDFPESEYPALPMDFTDTSWRNDSQPSMASKGLGLHIWCDRAAPAERELGGSRYGVTLLGPDGAPTQDEPVVQTDAWSDVLAFVNEHALRTIYVLPEGVDPQEAVTLGEFASLNAFDTEEIESAMYDLLKDGEARFGIGGGFIIVRRVYPGAEEGVTTMMVGAAVRDGLDLLDGVEDEAGIRHYALDLDTSDLNNLVLAINSQRFRISITRIG